MSWQEADPETPKKRDTTVEEAERNAETILAEAEQRARQVLERAEAQAEDENAARVQATQKEFDRLARLRRDVASGLLEVSKAAERDARRLLSAESKAAADAAETDQEVVQPVTTVGITSPDSTSWWSGGRRLYGSFLVGLACGFALAVLTRSESGDVPRASVEATQQTHVTDRADVPEPVESTRAQSENTDRSDAPLADRLMPTTGASGGIRLTLTAKEECWVRVHVDDDEDWERLMLPRQTIEVNATEQATVRVGDAAALSMLINDRVVKPLGAQGQVVNLRITPENYHTFLVTDSSRP